VTRHPADLLSLVAGLAVLGLGLVLLTGGAGDLPMEWVGPVVAIGIGVLILVAARQGRGSDDDAAARGDEA
jgi:divalent metal cation (Fe/Co/Zn/Cd) transporter